MTMTTTKTHIRWMIRRDMPEVLAIESASFDHPWCEDEFLQAMRQRNVVGMVCEQRERVVGFFLYSLARKRIRILNLAVHPAHRRQGIGSQAVAKLTGKLAPGRRDRILAAVRESNLDAQLFYRAAGFRAIRVIRDYYPDTREDAYAFRFQANRGF